jgi:hypothetical protein
VAGVTTTTTDVTVAAIDEMDSMYAAPAQRSCDE